MTTNRRIAAAIAAAATTAMLTACTGTDNATPPAPITHTVTQTATRIVEVPTTYPPYWHQTAPASCEEDMPCWIGSNQDDRSDEESLHDWELFLRTTD